MQVSSECAWRQDKHLRDVFLLVVFVACPGLLLETVPLSTGKTSKRDEAIKRKSDSYTLT
jgi:hypothetical protein